MIAFYLNYWDYYLGSVDWIWWKYIDIFFQVQVEAINEINSIVLQLILVHFILFYFMFKKPMQNLLKCYHNNFKCGNLGLTYIAHFRQHIKVSLSKNYIKCHPWNIIVFFWVFFFSINCFFFVDTYRRRKQKSSKIQFQNKKIEKEKHKQERTFSHIQHCVLCTKLNEPFCIDRVWTKPTVEIRLK